MEEDLAILIADLSGYTALTETHGAAAAADMVETFDRIVNESLVGDTHLHQAIGDEVLLVSTSPDNLMCTAIVLMKRCSNEPSFLQLHGGLHYGKLLKRNNNYFGSAINLASRIASKATQGTFWCSDEFVNSLSDRSGLTFQSQGKHLFKNVSGDSHVYELVLEGIEPFYIDPICRMLVPKTTGALRHPELQDIFFCSPDCLEIYMKAQPVINHGSKIL